MPLNDVWSIRLCFLLNAHFFWIIHFDRLKYDTFSHLEWSRLLYLERMLVEGLARHVASSRAESSEIKCTRASESVLMPHQAINQYALEGSHLISRV